MSYAVVARLIQIMLSVASIKLSTSLLPPEQMGRLALINSTVALFSYSLLTPAGMFINRRTHDWWNLGRWRIYTYYYLCYLIVVAVLAGTSFCIASPLFTSLALDNFWMFIIVFGSVLAINSNQFLIPTLNLLGFIRPFSQLTILSPALGLLLAGFICLAIAPKTEYWIFGLMVGQAVPALIAGWIIFDKQSGKELTGSRKTRISKAMLARLSGFAWPIAFAMVLGWVQSQGYRVILEKNVGLANLGLFVAQYGIALGVMSAVDSVLGTRLQPNFYRRLSIPGPKTAAEAWNDYANTSVPVLMFAAVCLVCVAHEASTLLLAKSYQQTVSFIIWGSFIELIRTLANTYALIFYAKMETKRLILPNLLGAILSIALLSLFSEIWGIDAAGPALSISGIVLLLTFHIRLQRTASIRFPWKRVQLTILAGAALFVATYSLRLSVPTAYSLRSLAIISTVSIAFALFLRTLSRQSRPPTKDWLVQ